MKEEKAKTISLSTFFLILSIIIIAIMGLFIYNLNNDKTTETKKSAELQTKANNLNNNINELQEKMGSAYIFISHDLSVVKHIADRVGVMYLGNMMEMADTESHYAKPLHPYTQALFSAIPRIGKERIEDKQILGGDVPSPANPPKGCRFCTRCPKVMDICKTDRPDFKEVEPGHFCACHLYDKK